MPRGSLSESVPTHLHWSTYAQRSLLAVNIRASALLSDPTYHFPVFCLSRKLDVTHVHKKQFGSKRTGATQSKPNGPLRTANSNPRARNGVRNAVWNGEWKIVSRFPDSWSHRFAREGSTSLSALLKHFVVHPSKAAVRPQNSTGVAIPLIRLSTIIIRASQYWGGLWQGKQEGFIYICTSLLPRCYFEFVSKGIILSGCTCLPLCFWHISYYTVLFLSACTLVYVSLLLPDVMKGGRKPYLLFFVALRPLPSGAK